MVNLSTCAADLENAGSRCLEVAKSLDVRWTAVVPKFRKQNPSVSQDFRRGCFQFGGERVDFHSSIREDIWLKLSRTLSSRYSGIAAAEVSEIRKNSGASPTKISDRERSVDFAWGDSCRFRGGLASNLGCT
jgi:hypothetical protein